MGTALTIVIFIIIVSDICLLPLIMHIENKNGKWIISDDKNKCPEFWEMTKNYLNMQCIIGAAILIYTIIEKVIL